MKVTASVLALASSAALVAAGCTNATAHPPAGSRFATNIAPAGPPSPVPEANSMRSTDADGNPACPVADSWGKSPVDKGIFVTYWDNQTDYVTALVRTTMGTDFAKSATLDPDHQPLIFDFPNIDARAVKEVLMTTNVKRCFATADPATSGR